MERNIRTFDLSSPIQALQFATFLLRLRDQSEKLRALFEEKKIEFVKKAQSRKSTEWTKEAQSKLYQGEKNQSKAHVDVDVEVRQ
jgi:hypothetical protein